MHEAEVNHRSATRVGVEGVELIPCINVFAHDTHWVWGTSDSSTYNTIPFEHQVVFVAGK